MYYARQSHTKNRYLIVLIEILFIDEEITVFIISQFTIGVVSDVMFL